MKSGEKRYCNSHEFIINIITSASHVPSSDSIEPDSLRFALRFAFGDPGSVSQTYTTRQHRFTVKSQIIDNSYNKTKSSDSGMPRIMVRGWKAYLGSSGTTPY